MNVVPGSRPFGRASLGACLLSIACVATAHDARGGGTDLRINEIRVDQSGSDIDEYFELFGGANDSLDALTYIVIGDGVGGSGVVDTAISLSGQTLDASGFFRGC